jgi:hypothetical protein
MAESPNYVGSQTVAAPSEVQAIAPYEHTGIPVAVQIGSPRPSVQISIAPYDAAVGKPRALARLALGTVLRAGAIGLGAYAVGVRDKKQLVVGSLAASATLSLILTGYHAVRTRRSW